jgi:hypothetical protein
MVILLAVAIGLIVMVIVYRGVVKEVGPFDFHTTTRVVGELKREIQHVDVGSANAMRADIKMTAGVLQLMGGAQAAMEAEFTYDDADWGPARVEYGITDAGQGELMVEQMATGRPAMQAGRCEWILRLNQDIPTELKVRLGAGKANLKLSSLTLNRLHIESGVGQLDLDLNGNWERSLSAYIKAGIGDTTLRLPHDCGVRIQSSVGFGSIQPHGLVWDGEAYTNALYGQVPVNLDITMEGGMGNINFQ